MSSLRTPVQTILLLVSFAQLLTLQAQTVSWTKIGYSSPPSARQNAAMAYNPATRSLVLFGGDGENSILGDTWTWNGVWHAIPPAAAPSPRQGAAMSLDAASGNVVLFGGSPTAPVGIGTAFGDTWTWDGLNWTQQFPPLSPPARVWSSMVYIPETKTVLLFGGTNSPNQENCFDDTWEWNGLAKTWTQRTPSTHPPGRTMNQLVHDDATHTVLLFGGVTTNLTDLNDTWIWDGVDWTQHTPLTNPGPRNGPALAYDPGLGAVVLFGGAVGPCCSNNLNDTWTWVGGNWIQIYPVNTLPAARNAPGLAYDPSLKSLIMFGGDGNRSLLGDTTTPEIPKNHPQNCPPH